MTFMILYGSRHQFIIISRQFLSCKVISQFIWRHTQSPQGEKSSCYDNRKRQRWPISHSISLWSTFRSWTILKQP